MLSSPRPAAFYRDRNITSEKEGTLELGIKVKAVQSALFAYDITFGDGYAV